MIPVPTDRRPLLSYLRVQEKHDREVLFILRRSSARIDVELRRLVSKQGVGAEIRRAQLRASQRAIKLELAALWQKIGSQVEADRAEAAAAAIHVNGDYDRVLWRATRSRIDVDTLTRSLEASARRGVATVEARALGLSRIPLSRRVYKTQQLTAGQVDRVIDSALARGASARELATDVRRFIDPRTRGGVRYAAQRLGRTELNNAFHATQVLDAQNKPWITGMRWNLSGSHPVPDECDEYASEDDGVFTPANVPMKPHPQCLCYVTPESVSPEEFRRQFESGAYDDFIT